MIMQYGDAGAVGIDGAEVVNPHVRITDFDQISHEIHPGVSIMTGPILYLSADIFGPNGVTKQLCPQLHAHLNKLEYKPLPRGELEVVRNLCG